MGIQFSVGQYNLHTAMKVDQCSTDQVQGFIVNWSN